MRIAQVAPLTEAVPPKLYGGTERVVSWLTEELVSLGHDVTLFASGDSQTAAKLEATWPKALRLDGAGSATAVDAWKFTAGLRWSTDRMRGREYARLVNHYVAEQFVVQLLVGKGLFDGFRDALMHLPAQDAAVWDSMKQILLKNGRDPNLR